jgi:hypothetical protein
VGAIVTEAVNVARATNRLSVATILTLRRFILHHPDVAEPASAGARTVPSEPQGTVGIDGRSAWSFGKIGGPQPEDE